MLILAGVSLNALVGDNGIIRQAMNASWLNEMTAVQEAFEQWKVQHYDDDLIPTNGAVSVNTVEDSERLPGEIGYYRVWSNFNEKPDLPVNTDEDIFNTTYSAELMYIPGGVEDLYYLNTSKIGIKTNNSYIIDTVNSMIYSVTGMDVNGIRAYSLAMYKALTSGWEGMPNFAEGEAGGNASAKNLAGKYTTEFLMNDNYEYIDEEGNIVDESHKIRNENYNPNGFRIICYQNSGNIYKLYNNGELYGKGLKCRAFGNSQELTDLNQIFEVTIPQQIPGADENLVTLIPGWGQMFAIDKNKELWAWGSNSSNCFGLTEEEMKEYIATSPIKLNVNGKQVKKVFTSSPSGDVFVITMDNELYGCGDNDSYELGLGHNNGVTTFTKITIKNKDGVEIDVSKIKNIHCMSYNDYTLIELTDHTYFYSGANNYGQLAMSKSASGVYTQFRQIWNGYAYKESTGTWTNYSESRDIAQKIQKISCGSSIMILTTDNKLIGVGYRGGSSAYGNGTNELPGSASTFQYYPETYGTNVIDIYRVYDGRVILRSDSTGKIEVWYNPGKSNLYGFDFDATSEESLKFHKLTIPNELEISGIKEIFTTTNTIMFLSNDGYVYAIGEKNESETISGRSRTLAYTPFEKKQFSINGIEILIDTFYNTPMVAYQTGLDNAIQTRLMYGKDGKIYAFGGNKSIFLGSTYYQPTWKKIATNVRDFYYGGDQLGSAYITWDNRLFLQR